MMNVGGDFQKVQISVNARKLADLDTFSKSDPYVVMSLQDNNTQKYREIGRTQIVKDNLNPNFLKSFIVDYIFEINQECRFEVRDDDEGGQYDIIGFADTSIGAIVGARNQVLILNLRDGQSTHERGQLILRAERVNECRDMYLMKWKGIKLMNTDGWFGQSDPFLRFFKLNQDNTYTLVYETEVIMDNLNPIWKVIQIPAQKLNNGIEQRKIKIECWDWEQSQVFQFIGQVETTIQEMKDGLKEFVLKNSKEKQPGMLNLEQFGITVRPHFIDYIRGGLQLNLIVAVDFTGSNGDVRSPKSLHYIDPRGSFNQYQQAITAVGNILINYDYDQQVPCYGFGGKPHFPTLNSNNVVHCFPMTGSPDQPQAVGGVGQILKIYSYSLNQVELSGPTYFTPILVETMKVCKQLKSAGPNSYAILLILTDGAIHDMETTKQAIIDSCDLPLSVIIVGVGNADFSLMEVLDGDEGLFDDRGRKAQRDLVQFVPFSKLSGNPGLLAQQVLAEIPDQVVDYFQLIGYPPGKPIITDVNDIQTGPEINNKMLNIGGAFLNNLGLIENNNGGGGAPPPPNPLFDEHKYPPVNQPLNPSIYTPPPNQQNNYNYTQGNTGKIMGGFINPYIQGYQQPPPPQNQYMGPPPSHSQYVPPPPPSQSMYNPYPPQNNLGYGSMYSPPPNNMGMSHQPQNYQYPNLSTNSNLSPQPPPNILLSNVNQSHSNNNNQPQNPSTQPSIG